ncbi:MAG: hypothetical protein B6245_17970 [Desulfobacteraceae bacterium 4572_88]|nr:MAG: hypothetical protein B6245_17970 [Desulfobacteraceae bacterium 4572_88]
MNHIFLYLCESLRVRPGFSEECLEMAAVSFTKGRKDFSVCFTHSGFRKRKHSSAHLMRGHQSLNFN